MKIEVHNQCSDYQSYRAARVKSLFNVESGADFRINADLPIDDDDWAIGVIVGPSGSGKTSLGRKVFGDEAFYEADGWLDNAPIVDSILPDGDFDAVTAALGSVGLGDVPAWLRPYRVLSNGEKFRADIARIIAESPAKIVIDEFTSVVDRQIAKIGALAFAKSWRRTNGQAVLLSCHYDIIDWIEPDWIFDTATGKYSGRSLWRRPKFTLTIRQTDASYWRYFEPHHYLKLHLPVGATYYVGTVDGELVAHLAVATRPGLRFCRGTRLVVMPEWQGAGVGTKFLNSIAEMWLQGENRFNKPMAMDFHTSHPQLIGYLKRTPKWAQISRQMFGANKNKSRKTIMPSGGAATGYGGHLRGVSGFRYVSNRFQ